MTLPIRISTLYQCRTAKEAVWQSWNSRRNLKPYNSQIKNSSDSFFSSLMPVPRTTSKMLSTFSETSLVLLLHEFIQNTPNMSTIDVHVAALAEIRNNSQSKCPFLYNSASSLFIFYGSRKLRVV